MINVFDDVLFARVLIHLVPCTRWIDMNRWIRIIVIESKLMCLLQAAKDNISLPANP